MGRIADDNEEAKKFLIGDSEENDIKDDLMLGYQSMPANLIPSKGMFMDPGLTVQYRDLTIPEIKTMSSVNDDSIISTNAATSMIMNNCIKITGGVSIRNGKILCEIDRVFMLFIIRDLTLTKKSRENNMMNKSSCPSCGNKASCVIDHSVFGDITISKKLLKHYSESKRAFVISHDLFDSPLVVRPPSIGVIDRILSYMVKKERSKRSGGSGYYDETALSLVQFITKSHVGLTDEKIEETVKVIKGWSPEKFQALIYVKELMAESVQSTTKMVCKKKECDGGTWQSPITFRTSHLFDLQNIIRDLF